MPQQELKKLAVVAVYIFQRKDVFLVEEHRGPGRGQHCVENVELVCEGTAELWEWSCISKPIVFSPSVLNGSQ